ncbi:MAG: hypothetical protein JOZ10_09510 [Acidobacteria bacterium]|nr:hypothetical protein [Acidobacteriota bacterium]MBV9144436.1 hypothetical protein [Acidobacteriota bacterium]MBV9437160.1 hypothetical protein [Acidobacteriota bacterium]
MNIDPADPQTGQAVTINERQHLVVFRSAHMRKLQQQHQDFRPALKNAERQFYDVIQLTQRFNLKPIPRLQDSGLHG